MVLEAFEPRRKETHFIQSYSTRLPHGTLGDPLFVHPLRMIRWQHEGGTHYCITAVTFSHDRTRRMSEARGKTARQLAATRPLLLYLLAPHIRAMTDVHDLKRWTGWRT